MTIPILGSGDIPAQLRTNVTTMVGEVIQQATRIGLRIAQLKLQLPIETNEVIYPLAIEELERRGLEILSINEMAIVTPQAGLVIVSIMFRTTLEPAALLKH